MTRSYNDFQSTAAPDEPVGCGCLSGFMLPPLVVLLIGAAVTTFAFHAASAGNSSDAAVGDSLSLPADQPGSGLSRIFTPQVQHWGPSILRWAADYGLDPNLVAVVMQIESCGDPSALSRSGAMGLFQVMPFHFLGSDNPYSPETNAARGLSYLGRSFSAAGQDARLALAGYNGGIGAVSRGEWYWPAETLRYANWGSGMYADALSGAETSSALADWYARAGAGMCTRASRQLGLAQ